MSGADWFARKMAGNAPQAGRVQAPTPHVTPGGLRLPPSQVQPQPVQQELVQQATTGTLTGKENFQGILDEAARTGENISFTKLSRHWKGGEAMRTEGHIRCPNCDSMNIFTRSKVGRVTNTTTGVSSGAKPRCFDCGWTEDHMQGDSSNWGG